MAVAGSPCRRTSQCSGVPDGAPAPDERTPRCRPAPPAGATHAGVTSRRARDRIASPRSSRCCATPSACSPTSGSRRGPPRSTGPASSPQDLRRAARRPRHPGAAVPGGARRPRRRAADDLPRGRAAQPGLCDDRASSSPSRSSARCPSSSPARPSSRPAGSRGWRRGERLIAFALTEAEAGSDAAAIRTTAVRDGDDYVIDGARSASSARARSPTSSPSSPSPTRTRPATSACRASSSRSRPTASAVEPDRAQDGHPRQPDGRARLRWRPRPGGEPASARRATASTLAMRTLDRSRPGIAAQAVGIAQGALEVATRVRARAQAVRAAHRRLPDGRARCSPTWTPATEAARQLLYKACIEIEAGAPDASRWSAMCKLVAGDTAMRVTTDAVQVLGGYGYIDEFPVERMMRDAKITQLYEGTQQIQRLVIARACSARAADRAGRSRSPVRIVVLMKPVPDPASVRRTPRPGRSARPSGVPAVVNGNDEYALEAALKLVEAAGGARSSCCRWPRRARPRRCARPSRWAPPAASLVTDPALGGSCAVATAPRPRGGPQDARVRPRPRRRRHVRRGGRRRPAGVAALHGLPLPLVRRERSSPTRRPGPSASGGSRPTGYDVLEAPMPALISGTQALGEPRYPSLKGIMGARSKEIATLSLADLGIDPATVGRRRGDDQGRRVRQPPPARAATRVIREAPGRGRPRRSSPSSPSGGSSDGAAAGRRRGRAGWLDHEALDRGRDARPDAGRAGWARSWPGVVVGRAAPTPRPRSSPRTCRGRRIDDRGWPPMRSVVEIAAAVLAAALDGGRPRPRAGQPGRP